MKKITLVLSLLTITLVGCGQKVHHLPAIPNDSNPFMCLEHDPGNPDTTVTCFRSAGL